MFHKLSTACLIHFLAISPLVDGAPILGAVLNPLGIVLGAVLASNKSPATTTSSAPKASSTPFAPVPAAQASIRGVNVGGWLVLEPWMNADIMAASGAVDQWNFDQTPGAAQTLQNHWSTYFTQADVAQLVSWGVNSIRIPVGYWAYNNTGTPYLSGADAYLEQALGWLKGTGIMAVICVHGSPGSQNGMAHSGHAGSTQWQKNNNLNLSTTILQTITKKYGTAGFADVVYGIELVNEPTNGSPNDPALTQQWVQTTFASMKAVATNPNLRIISNDGYAGASNWATVNSNLNGKTPADNASFVLDIHLFQNQISIDSTMSQDQHIAKACNYDTTAFVQGMPTIVGEFSAQTNICWYPNGQILPGTVCAVKGCQCSATTDMSEWSPSLVNATRKFVEAELETFEANTLGYFLWSYKAPGAWGLTNLFKYGVLGPNTISDRQYPNICS